MLMLIEMQVLHHNLASAALELPRRVGLGFLRKKRACMFLILQVEFYFRAKEGWVMTYDVAVLGGGPGGYEAAIRCAGYGLKTALIEARELGGTCLNRGCIPTKALLHSGELFLDVRAGAAAGVSVSSAQFDYAVMAARKDHVVQRLRGGIAFLEKAYGVDVIQGFGVLTGQHEIKVNDTCILAEKIILATGSSPALPPIPGAESSKIVTSDEVLNLTQVPESIAIVGGGVIGLEFATLFSALGVSTTVLEMLPELLPDLDREIANVVQRRLKRCGVRIQTGVRVTNFEENGDSVSVWYEDADGVRQNVPAQICTICAGRRPETGKIGLEQAGVVCDKHGFVPVDEYMRTNVRHIYAIGDITGKLQLAHVATAQGLAAAENCAGHDSVMDYEAIPSCIYTLPEAASIGKNAKKLSDEGVEFVTGEFRASGNGRAMTLGETDGIVKIYAAKKDGRILGAQIAAPHASDMIAEIGVLMHFGGTAKDLGKVVHPHPSLSEMIAEAAHDVDGLSCNSLPKNKEGTEWVREE